MTGTASPQDLLEQWGAAWVTKDDDERRRLLEACAAAEVEFFPPDARPSCHGREALIAHVSEYTKAWPAGVTATVDGPVDTHHGWSRAIIAWGFPAADAVGVEIMHVAGGKITAMIVFADVYVETQGVTGGPR